MHRELPWVGSVSNDDYELFLMYQEWATPGDVEMHLKSAHAEHFNGTLMSKKVLFSEPNVSIFSSPLGTAEIAGLGAEAAMHAQASLAARAEQADAAPTRSDTGAVSAAAREGGCALPLSPGRELGSSTPRTSRGSSLRSSGAMAL